MGAEQLNGSYTENGDTAFQQETAEQSALLETDEPVTISLEDQEDGSLLLSGRIILSFFKEDEQQAQVETETLRLSSYVPGESWVIPEEGQLDGGKKIVVSGGTLSRQEDGSLLVESSEEAPVTLELAESDEEADTGGFHVEYTGESLLAEEESAAVSETEEVQKQQPVQEQIAVEWTDGSLKFYDPITFHSSQDGFRVEQQAARLEIRNFSDGEEWAARNGGVVSDDQLISISGGVCTAEENGSVLIIDNSAENPVSVSSFQADDSHEAHAGVCVEYSGTLGPVIEIPASTGVPLWCLGGAALLAALLGAGVTALLKGRKKSKPIMQQPVPAPITNTVINSEESASHLDYGMLQNIGKRASQQDSYGLFGVSGGVLAVVADGMGGLKNGDAVSQKIVQTMEEDCKKLTAAQMRGNLTAMASHANDEVNRMLGPNELYKSGSTLVAALAEPQQFSWVSIGDSRIYLYRAGRLLQLNREHDYEAELMLRAVNHQLSFPEARSNPKRKSVSSFIGMGSLKYVDEMRKPIQTLKGDRILLCSDGIFNTLTERHIESILAEYPNPKTAAANLEAAVLAANNPHQDNFTAILFSYD